MPEQTLLEKAMSNQPRRGINKRQDPDEMIDLAIAYVEGRISCSQAAFACGITKGTGGNVITRLAGAIISGARRGILRIERIK